MLSVRYKMASLKYGGLLMSMLAVIFSGLAIAQLQTMSRSAVEESVRAFVGEYVKSSGPDASGARFTDAFIDLDGDGLDEVIVYLTGRNWCGTSGCSTLILKRRGKSFRMVTRIVATRPPIRALKEVHHGWRTLTA